MSKTAVLWLAKRLGLFRLSRRLTREHLRILCYHGIWLGDGHYGNFLFMSPGKFEGRMRLLAASGYPVLPLDAAVQRLQDGSLPDDAVAITIDDGWQGTATHMLPVLARLGLPATVYVTSYHCEHQTPVVDPAVGYMLATCTRQAVEIRGLGDAVDGVHELRQPGQREALAQKLRAHIDAQPVAERTRLCIELGRCLGVDFERILDRKLFCIMTPEQVREAARQGFDIQLHTHRHRIACGGADCLAQEIDDNRRSLEPLVGHALRHFCYPSGEHHAGCYPTLTARGIVSATTTEAGLATRASHPLALPRLLDGEAVSPLEFEAELSGFLELVRAARRRLSRSRPRVPVAGAPAGSIRARETPR